MNRKAGLAALAAGATLATAAGASTRALIGPHPTAAERAVVTRVFGAQAPRMMPFNAGKADINGDGRPDLIIWPQNKEWCNAEGCAMFAIPATANGYANRPIPLTITQSATLTVLNSVHGGLHDIALEGRLAGSLVTYAWNGRKYERQGAPDTGGLQLACQGSVAAKGRAAAQHDDLPVGKSPRACFAILPIYNLSSGEIVAAEPSPACPRGKAIDAYSKSGAGGWYNLFDKPVCGTSISIGPPQDGRRIATIVIDGRRYGDVAGTFRQLR
jgi:hypothetical protein